MNNCHIYPLAKQTKLTFPISDIRFVAFFDIAHMDLWGLYKNPTIDRKYYFLIVVDV